MNTAAAPCLAVLGSLSDVHVERVVERVRAQLDVRVAVLDFVRPAQVGLRMDSLGQYQIEVDGERLPNALLIWDRMKMIRGSVLYPAGDARESEYVVQEWQGLYQAVRELYRHALVNPVAGRLCPTKLYQQAIAARHGFNVPPSLIANAKAELLQFQAAQRGHTIMKSVSGRPVRPEPGQRDAAYHVMTMRLAPEDLRDADPATLACCPHLVQAEVAKDYELRIVVAGDRLLAFRVLSQESALSRVDWRKGYDVARFEACTLEPELRERVLAFQREAGLVFGSVDLIIDLTGEAWFLESNPDGAWGWLDDLVDGRVADLHADYLVQRLIRLGAPRRHGVAAMAAE